MSKEDYKVGDLYDFGQKDGLGLVLEVYGNKAYKVYSFADKSVLVRFNKRLAKCEHEALREVRNENN